jgi:hypothetical protein
MANLVSIAHSDSFYAAFYALFAQRAYCEYVGLKGTPYLHVHPFAHQHVSPLKSPKLFRLILNFWAADSKVHRAILISVWIT